MKIAILGFARDGKAAFEHWNSPDNQITICDADATITLPEGVACQLGADYLKNLDQFDLIVRSAGLQPSLIAAANSPEILKKVTGNIDEFYRCSPSKNIIGVTGTKGKGTTCTLITKLLEASGKKVHLGGNIGIPALELLKNNIQAEDWVVLEQSSFQLMDQQNAPHIAVCLMVVAEHLNWHATMEEYVAAKKRLFALQKPEDTVVFNRLSDLSQQIGNSSPANTKLSYEVPAPGAMPTNLTDAYVKDEAIFMDDTEVCKVADVKLLGRHNLQNVCAALAASWDIISQDASVVKAVVSSFTGLEHHLELVKDLNGIRFYDDSFGTTPETAIVAIEAFQQPKVLILGGSSKQSNYEELAAAVLVSNVRKVVLIGDTGPIIKGALEAVGYNNAVEGGQTMSEIVKNAQAQAQPGDVVLLSTGCASFGLYKDYKDRGEQFRTAVAGLQ